MSTLNVSNITDGTTSVGTSYVVNGSAKAWINFNGTGTVAIEASLNTASLTDTGVGDYVVNFTSSFSSQEFVASGQTAGQWHYFSRYYLDTRSSSLYKAKCVNAAGNAYYDSNEFTIAFHGDLA